MLSNSFALAGLAAFSHIASAAPQYTFGTVDCSQDDTVVIDSQNPIIGNSFGFGSTVTSGEHITYTSSYSIGTTWTLGGSIDISKIIGVGLSASVSETITQGASQSLGADCPEGGAWTCSATMAPSVLEVSGHMDTKCLNADGSNMGPYRYFTVQIPMYTGDQVPIMHMGPICACQEFASWADAGAPSVVCPPGTCGL